MTSNHPRPTLRLPRKDAEVTKAERDAIVGPVRRTSRYMIHTYGKNGRKRTHGKIYHSLEVAREAARQVVASGFSDHAFVLHIVESAKLASDLVSEDE